MSHTNRNSQDTKKGRKGRKKPSNELLVKKEEDESAITGIKAISYYVTKARQAIHEIFIVTENKQIYLVF